MPAAPGSSTRRWQAVRSNFGGSARLRRAHPPKNRSSRAPVRHGARPRRWVPTPPRSWPRSVAVLHDVGGVVVQVGGAPEAAADVLVDSTEGVDAVADAVRANPLASAALTGVLRATELLPVDEGLAVESLAYSMLLAGPEFARWLDGRGPMDPPPGGDEPVLLEREGD